MSPTPNGLSAARPVRNDRTDWDGTETAGECCNPPPYLNVALLITATEPLWIPTLPHMEKPRVGVVGSLVTLIAGTMIVDCWVAGSKKDVVAVSSWMLVKRMPASALPSGTKLGLSGL